MCELDHTLLVFWMKCEEGAFSILFRDSLVLWLTSKTTNVDVEGRTLWVQVFIEALCDHGSDKVGWFFGGVQGWIWSGVNIAWWRSWEPCCWWSSPACHWACMFHILLILTIVLAWFLSLSKAVMSWNLVWEKGPQVDSWNQTTLNWATFSHKCASPDCLELISATTCSPLSDVKYIPQLSRWITCLVSQVM